MTKKKDNTPATVGDIQALIDTIKQGPGYYESQKPASSTESPPPKEPFWDKHFGSLVSLFIALVAFIWFCIQNYGALAVFKSTTEMRLSKIEKSISDFPNNYVLKKKS